MALPPAQSAYIFRGHATQIHSTSFIRSNSSLVTGDADGWIVVWSLATKRPTAVWRAHEGAILGAASWGGERLITHGKDNKLAVWKLTEQDELDMNVVLPVDDLTSHRKQPWLLYMLHVNTLNFCSFACCKAREELGHLEEESLAKFNDVDELLIAVPNTISSNTVDIFHLPSTRRLYTVSGDNSVTTGMVMALAIFHKGKDLTIIAGYESGHTMVSQQIGGQDWHVLYLSQPHSQPVLSLDVLPNKSHYITSSADANIAKHPIPNILWSVTNAPTISTPASATPKPTNSGPSLLSKALASSGPSNTTNSHPWKVEIETIPAKIIQTKHSGQQGLRVRSDGRIFATAGWDSRVRVYSTQTLKELAVLKWHKEGCYAVTFAEVMITSTAEQLEKPGEVETPSKDLQKRSSTKSNLTRSVVEKRISRVTTTHWLAAGSKDGKVSLWDIY